VRSISKGSSNEMKADPRVFRLAQAKLDLAEIATCLGREDPDLGLRFFQAAEETFRQLAETSGLGSPVESSNSRVATLRVWPVRGFENWLIFYRPIRDGISVARVLHGARDIERILGS